MPSLSIEDVTSSAVAAAARVAQASSTAALNAFAPFIVTRALSAVLLSYEFPPPPLSHCFFSPRRRRNLAEYRKFLESCDYMKVHSPWRKVQDRLEDDDRYLRLEEIDRLLVFQFFASNGFPCPALQNPSDHLLKTINKDFDQDIDMGLSGTRTVLTEEAIRIFISAYESSEINQQVQQEVAMLSKQKCNHYLRRFRKMHGKQRIIRSMNDYAEFLFQRWKQDIDDEDDPYSSGRPSWFRKQYTAGASGKHRNNGQGSHRYRNQWGMKTTVEKYLRSTLHSLSYLSNNKAGNGELVVVDSNDQTKLKHEDQKTLRRLAQNCEAARKSRLRKKAYVQQLKLNKSSLRTDI
ncbi:hypothetical protein Ahy_B04g072710 [Arachis hypogaea]|uniref:FF domain-containing protein n=1 Tax=Arachis hypogaea TaxID=3818 RepID=A0A444ZNJ9_ARAHY|nr:hypothetical protein Ahy_B04g072710 [Arachis hypogaea]